MTRLIENMASFTFMPTLETSNPSLPVDQQQSGVTVSSKRVYLDPGIYLVTMDWDGPEDAFMNLSRTVESPYFSQIMSTPAGSGPRSAMRKVVVSQTAILLPNIIAVQQATIDAKYALGLSVVRIGE